LDFSTRFFWSVFLISVPIFTFYCCREHYLKSSYGLLTIDSVVTDWVTIDYTEAYCADGNYGTSFIIHTCLKNALSKVDSVVNYSQFDVDCDKWIDAIGFLHSGYGAEWGGVDSFGATNTNRIWSHKWAMSTWTSAEGVSVSNYHISPAVWGISGSSIGRIGVIAHETGHL
jgi:M6 family metalloprotease-like protein